MKKTFNKSRNKLKITNNYNNFLKTILKILNQTFHCNNAFIKIIFELLLVVILLLLLEDKKSFNLLEKYFQMINFRSNHMERLNDVLLME